MVFSEGDIMALFILTGTFSIIYIRIKIYFYFCKQIFAGYFHHCHFYLRVWRQGTVYISRKHTYCEQYILHIHEMPVFDTFNIY